MSKKQQNQVTFTREEVWAAIKNLVEQGKLVDSGMRRLSPRTGEMQIVWVAVPPKKEFDS